MEQVRYVISELMNLQSLDALSHACVSYKYILQELNVDVYSKKYCMEMYGEEKIGDYHICVGKYGVGGVCNGDSGGPLACEVEGQWVLAGVTSWALGCDVNYPSVYTSVSYYRSWIKEVSGV